MIKGRLIKGVGGIYTVYSSGKVYECLSRGKIKLQTLFEVGDEVEFSLQEGTPYIEKILPRKNSLVRPKISNVDQILIIIAPTPKPDFLLLDKLLVYAYQKQIKPIICLNKIDLLKKEEMLIKLKKDYAFMRGDILAISAKTSQGLLELKKVLNKKLTVLAGQSAVGKSTILNMLAPQFKALVGELSKKLNKGKHTTRHTEIYPLTNNTFIADTPGFSLLEAPEVPFQRLSDYYPDFSVYQKDCKYKSCDHITSPLKDCAILRAVEEGKISKERYLRYETHFKEIKKRWDTKYD